MDDREPTSSTGSTPPALLPPPIDAKRSPVFPRQLASLLLFAVGGAVIGFLGTTLTARLGLQPSGGWSTGEVVAWFAVFLLAMWPNILVHEAGHAAAGLARGMRAIAFGVGPWRLERGSAGWRARHGGNLGGAGGFAALLPNGERGTSPADQAIFLLGGPMANLFTGAFGLWLAGRLAASEWPALVLSAASCSALLLGAINLVPFHSKGWRSDGRGLWDLLRKAPDAALQQQVNQLAALSLAGMRPRDWPEALLPSVDGASSTPLLVAAARMLRLARAMDQRDADLAYLEAVELPPALPLLPDSYRPHLAVAMADYAARMRRDAPMIAAWRPHCDGGLMDLSPYRAWLDAEHAALEGREADARRHLADARELSGRVQDAASLVLFHESVEALEARLGPDHARSNPDATPP